MANLKVQNTPYVHPFAEFLTGDRPNCACTCHKTKSKPTIPQPVKTQQPSQGSTWMGTAVKATTALAVLAAVGCGAYWLGASQAAKAAGQQFENFVEGFVNADPNVREQVVENLRNAAPIVERITQTLPSSGGNLLGNPAIGNLLPSSAGELLASGTSTLATSTQKVVHFGGKIAKGFKDLVLENTPGPNLAITRTVEEFVDGYTKPIVDTLQGVVALVEYTAIGTAATVGTVAFGYCMNAAGNLVRAIRG